MWRYISLLGVLVYFVASFNLTEGNNEKMDVELASREREVGFTFQKNCSSHDNVWFCCAGIERRMHFTACFSFGYIKENFHGGLELNVTVNDQLIIQETAQLRKLPPLCFQTPYLGKLANTCFTFRNLKEENNSLTGCVYLEGYFDGLRLFKFHLECFTVHLPKLEQI